MASPIILVVEDNPTTRKMLRVALECEGFAVLEAPDARTAIDHMVGNAPDLVIQDLVLPDMDGIQLTRRLRASPGGADVPILALSGLISRLEEARVVEAGFTAFLFKPIAPSQLIEIVRAHLPSPRPAPEDLGHGRRILLVDDNPVQLKLVRLQLTNVGFRVATAAGGRMALCCAVQDVPDLIVSDVLMPDLDGFDLCLAVRSTPRLADLPVVLVTSHYLEEPDRELAGKVGANRMVVRSPNSDQLIAAILESLREAPRRPPQESVEGLRKEHTHRVIRQMERQISLNTGLAQRGAIQGAQLALLGGVADALAGSVSIETTQRDVLAVCLDAMGASRGALFLLEPRGNFRLRHAIGYPDSILDQLGGLFGHSALFERAIARQSTVAIPSSEVAEQTARDLLSRAGTTSALIVPLASAGHQFGALFLGSSVDDVTGSDHHTFARTIGAQIGQSLAVDITMRLLTESSLVLAESLDYETTLGRVARLAVPFLADWCLVDLVEECGRIYRVPVAHVDPAKEGLLQELQDRYPTDWNSKHPAAMALRTGQPQLIQEAADTVIRSPGGDARCAELSRALLIRTGMAVPLIARDKVLGVISFGAAEGRCHGPADLNLAMEIARRAAMAIDNARLYRNAQEAIRARDEFLAIASHELKTPLTPLLLQVGRALSIVREGPGAGASERLVKCLEHADRQVRRLIKLITDLLDISHITSQSLHLEFAAVDLAVLVREVVARFAPEMAQAGCTLILHADLPVPGTWDRMRLDQVVTNLLSNAVKYGCGAPIEVSIMGDDIWARLQVRDHGIGIASKDQARIFERFERAVSVHQYGGFGLGLWIVHQIVCALGGLVKVESEPGAGALFTVELPRTPR